MVWEAEHKWPEKVRHEPAIKQKTEGSKKMSSLHFINASVNTHFLTTLPSLSLKLWTMQSKLNAARNSDINEL